MAEEVVCRHREKMSSSGKKGVCAECGQKKEYNLIHPKEPPTVTKRGRIKGVLTMIIPLGQEPEPLPAAAEVEATVPPVPEEWSIMTKTEKHTWLEKHRARIVSDLVTVGVVATGAKWHLSQSSLYTLIKQWDIKPAKRSLKAEPAQAEPLTSKALTQCVPDNWETMGKGEKHEWLVDHREAIVKDLETIGIPATARKWHLSASTLRSLARRKDVITKVVKSGPQSKRRVKAIRHGLMPKPTDDRHSSAEAKLPLFPAFNDSWPDVVQIVWLKVYAQLRNDNEKT